MAHHRPWYKRNGAALIMATLGFPDAETKWAYSTIIDMLNDRDRPLTDDAGFICGFTGLSRKKWAIVRRYLLTTESGSGETFLILTDRGDLSNPRFERELAERRGEHDRAVEHGRAGGIKSAAQRAGQTELDLPDQDPTRARALGAGPKVGAKSPRKSAESGAKSPPNGSAKAEPAAPKNNDLAQPPPQATRARQTPEIREEDSTHPDSESRPREAPSLVERVCEAAGYQPATTAQKDRTARIVAEWEREGFDFDSVVIPTIRAVVAAEPEPTRTLGRFTPRIRHEHARRAATPRSNGRAYSTPASPVFEVEGEDPQFIAFRHALHERMGNAAYCQWCNRVRFEAVADAGGGRKPLRVHDRSTASPLMDSDRASLVRNLARANGFTDVW